jgi:hypothetical protein
VNAKGHSETLVSSHPDNLSAARHGAYSRRFLDPRARDVAEELLAQPHIKPLDALGAQEIGALVAMLESIDADLANRGLTKRSGEARTLVKLRLQASRRLQDWCSQYGLTPRSRAELLRDLGATSVAVELARRREAEDAGD